MQGLGAPTLLGRMRIRSQPFVNEEPSRRWRTIPVPGLWTMVEGEQPFGDKPIYTNVQMPFDELPPNVPTNNPTGIYEREFTVPTSWVNKRIVLSIGGFESVAVVYINGVEVGSAKDSRLAADFDITDFVTNDSNEIRIKVIKWSDSSFIEDQDQWWHGGITRSVKLYATEEVFRARCSVFTFPFTKRIMIAVCRNE